MKKYAYLVVIVLALLGIGAALVVPGLKTSQYPNTTTFQGSDLLLLAVTNNSPPTNKNIKMSDMQAQMTNGLATTNYVNDATSGLASTNFVLTSTTNNVRIAPTNGVVVHTNINGFEVTYIIGATNPPGGDSIWTNDNGFVHFTQDATNDPSGLTPGPVFVLRTNDGSIFRGPNVNQDVTITDATKYYDYFIHMFDSNEVGRFQLSRWLVNNENYDYWSEFEQFQNATDLGQANTTIWSMMSTNGVYREWSMVLATNGTGNFLYSTESGIKFIVDEVGNVLRIRGVSYSWPETNGLTGQVLYDIDGAGTLSWKDASAGGSTNKFNGEVSLTNATTIGLVYDQVDATNRLRSLRGGNGITLTNEGTNIVIASTVTGSGLLTGTTNFINFSPQASHVPFTNFAVPDPAYPALELVYAETNAEGSRADLFGSWQFIVPPDYSTNSLQLLLNYSLINTNGPNTSNVIWGAQILAIRSGTTNNIRTNAFGFNTFITNNWIAKYDGTNITTNVVITLGTNALLAIGDLAVVNLFRDSTNDTYGGAVALHGLQGLYTRP